MAPAHVDPACSRSPGYFDAASAATGAVDHLIEFTGATRLATIDGDPFFDAQQVRPHVVLEDGVTRTIVWPENTIHANDELGRRPGARAAVGHRAALPLAPVHRAAGRGRASTPARRWWSRSARCRHRSRTAGCRSCTRPRRTPSSRSASGSHRPRYQGITGIVGTLQAALDHLGLPAISMQVGVPYYAAGAQNWKASAALLRNLEHVTGIPTGHGLLHEQVAEWEQLVDEAVAENPEASGYLPQLEAEYDRQAAEQLPSSDDLAAEFERYLRELDDPAFVRRVGTGVLVLVALLATFATNASAATPRRCNGAARLCGRSLGAVAFATTHNSMASSADGFRPPEPAAVPRGPARARHPRLPGRRVPRHAARHAACTPISRGRWATPPSSRPRS